MKEPLEYVYLDFGRLSKHAMRIQDALYLDLFSVVRHILCFFFVFSALQPNAIGTLQVSESFLPAI